MDGLRSAVSELKKGRSPGPDEVGSEMLIGLGTVTGTKLLEMFGHSWMGERCPRCGERQ